MSIPLEFCYGLCLLGIFFIFKKSLHSPYIPIFNREYPYVNSGLNPFQLMPKVVAGLRPPMTPGTFPPKLANLIISCWAGDPLERPEFSAILQDLKDPDLFSMSPM
jgi:hypothetical protein